MNIISNENSLCLINIHILILCLLGSK